ncbi:MAG TPA: hypothetical protein VFI23_09360 [Rhizomicrobium sp.]|nr:hypothetical protein [Rhizomicrobium sp.]
MTVIRITLASLLAILVAIPVQAQTFLPIDRSKVLSLFGADNFKEMPIPAENAPADIKQLQADGDTVWIFYDKSIQTRIAMAGHDGHIHSLRILVAVVNNSEQINNQVLAALSSLFSTIYPDWSEAKEWPRQSLSLSWSATAREMNPNTRRGASTGTEDDLIPSRRASGITASTFGVPPDLVVYAVTTRDACVPHRSASGRPQDDPIKRLIC